MVGISIRDSSNGSHLILAEFSPGDNLVTQVQLEILIGTKMPKQQRFKTIYLTSNANFLTTF